MIIRAFPDIICQANYEDRRHPALFALLLLAGTILDYMSVELLRPVV
jgi:hypothetical protein